MSIKVEIAGSTFVAQDKEIGGIRVRGTNLGIAYSGTENGGRVVIAKKVENPNYIEGQDDPKNRYTYDYKQPIVIRKGEEPVTKEFVRKTEDGNQHVISVKISAS